MRNKRMIDHLNSQQHTPPEPCYAWHTYVRELQGVLRDNAPEGFDERAIELNYGDGTFTIRMTKGMIETAPQQFVSVSEWVNIDVCDNQATQLMNAMLDLARRISSTTRGIYGCINQIKNGV